MTSPMTPANKILTLCVVTTPTHVLLGMKKRGFGVGKWNGFGGKVHAGETVEEAAARELSEEAGIEAQDLTPRGTIIFYDVVPEVLEVRLFSATRYRGVPQETEEMSARWFAHEDIPYTQMWLDDRHWLPHILAGQDIDARFWFEGDERLLRQEIRVIEHEPVISHALSGSPMARARPRRTRE